MWFFNKIKLNVFNKIVLIKLSITDAIDPNLKLELLLLFLLII